MKRSRVSLAADESGAHWAKAPFAILIVQDALLPSKNLTQRVIFGNQSKRDPRGCSREAPEPHAAEILPGNRLKYTFVGVASPCVPGCLRSRKKKKKKHSNPAFTAVMILTAIPFRTPLRKLYNELPQHNGWKRGV